MTFRTSPSAIEQALLPHLDAAYNLARWLVRNDQDAEDAVQEACLRAVRFFKAFRGGDGRGWLLGIVRNTCYDFLARRGAQQDSTPFDEQVHVGEAAPETPETILLQRLDRDTVHRALEELPTAWREVLVLRELEGLSYKEIAAIVAVPVGTVMSRLARARARLQQHLQERAMEDRRREVR